LEHIALILNNAAAFDAVVHGTDGVPTLLEGGDVRIITKDDATEDGCAVAVITFTVEVDGKPMRAQAVVTVRLLTSTLRVLHARYGNNGKAGSDEQPH